MDQFQENVIIFFKDKIEEHAEKFKQSRVLSTCPSNRSESYYRFSGGGKRFPNYQEKAMAVKLPKPRLPRFWVIISPLTYYFKAINLFITILK
jgi:hypothetical protein